LPDRQSLRNKVVDIEIAFYQNKKKTIYKKPAYTRFHRLKKTALQTFTDPAIVLSLLMLLFTLSAVFLSLWKRVYAGFL
jgi:hypothetical protein